MFHVGCTVQTVAVDLVPTLVELLFSANLYADQQTKTLLARICFLGLECMIKTARIVQIAACGLLGSLAYYLVAIPEAESVQSDVLPTPPWKQIVLLADKGINESSGLVISDQNEDCFWTHNDSGDLPRLFLVHRDGRTIARFQLAGVKAIDWEDIATASIGGSPKIIIGDIGGNAQARKHISLHIVSEPRFVYDGTSPTKPIEFSAAVETTINVIIPGGVTNFEGIAVDQEAGLILLVEKSLLGGRVYTVALPSAVVVAKNTIEARAQEIGHTSIPYACACDISRDGNALVITNYTLGYLFSRQKSAEGKAESWSDTLKREPIAFRLPKMRQTEAACFSKDGTSLFLTSEQIPTPLIEQMLSNLK